MNSKNIKKTITARKVLKKKKVNTLNASPASKPSRKKPITKVSLENCKFYIYLPKSYYRSRTDSATNILKLGDSYEIDLKGRGFFERLDDCVKAISENKTYSKCVDELVLLEVSTTNVTLFAALSVFFEQYSNRYKDYELVVHKEIDFKRLLALA